MEKDLNYLITLIADYLNKILLLLMGFAVLMFVWNVIKYFIRSGESDRKEGAQYVMWSVVGFFVILTFWGIVNILIGTFDIGYKPSSWQEYFDIFPRP